MMIKAKNEIQMSRILFVAILLVFSCEQLLESEDCLGVVGGHAELDNCDVCDTDSSNDCVQDCSGVWGGNNICGCTIITACNYDATATNNLGCVFPQGCNEWCEGDEGIVKEFDCTYDSDDESTWEAACGGSSALDNCGICDTDDDNDCEYESIIIGEQTWTLENIMVTHFNNGDEIPTGYTNENLTNLTDGAYVVYNNTASNTETYGNLYNWYAVNDARGLCPVGWHVPSVDEYTLLADSLGGNAVASGKMKSTGTIEGGNGLWEEPNEGATNESGFGAIPGGYYDGENFKFLGSTGYFWSSNDDRIYDEQADGLFLDADSDSLSLPSPSNKSSYYSIRCIKN